MILILAVQLVWLWSVVSVARTKTEDPYDRIVWLLVVLTLNIVGTILYLFFGADDREGEGNASSEEELKRRMNAPGEP